MSYQSISDVFSRQRRAELMAAGYAFLECFAIARTFQKKSLGSMGPPSS